MIVGDIERQIYSALLYGGLILAPVVFVVVHWIPAPYGRYARRGWGPEISRRAGWVLMELPAVLCFGFFFLSGDLETATTTWVFFFLWQIHYLYRSLVFPFRLRDRGKTNPLLVVVLAVVFNLWNGYLNGRYLGAHAVAYTAEWLYDPRFIAGAGLWISGFLLNLHSDEILFRLRGPEETNYRIPYGGAYRFVSCPNYLGELIEWTGWAVLTWSLPGVFFVAWTAANLVPRARTHHKWYLENFPDYPRNRKIILPFVY